MSPVDRDLTHQELMDELKRMIDDLRVEVASYQSEGLASLEGVFRQRLDLVLERLEAGGGRFGNLEQMARVANEDRAALYRALQDHAERLIKLEMAKAIVEGVDQEVTDRALKWRRRDQPLHPLRHGQR